MARLDAIFIGIQGTVLALEPSTGTELWRTNLKGGGFVNLAFEGKTIIATTRGEVFALDRATGQVLWNNTLKGLGLGFVTIAGAAQAVVIGAVHASQQSDAGTAAAASSM